MNLTATIHIYCDLKGREEEESFQDKALNFAIQFSTTESQHITHAAFYFLLRRDPSAG
eukprot:m.17910 g.17910  ORF g.17910 m.17910 type:complete len:58 (+) comp8389_c0_seq1:272-445(+)